VINFSARTNDTAGNIRTNDTIITIADTPSTVTIANNNSAPRVNEVVNISADVTDVDGLGLCLIKTNQTGTFVNNTFALSGTTDSCSDEITMTVIRGNVVNFTVQVNDTIGDILYQDSTTVTIENTPVSNLSIIFPAGNRTTNQQPLQLNITYDNQDDDSVNISYYIDGIINQTQLNINTTLNVSDGSYILNISIIDVGAGGPTTFNTTVNFTIDTTPPIVNTTLNKSTDEIKINDIINLTANVTDFISLDTGQIIVNDTGFNRIFNTTLAGSAGAFSQNISISCVRGCVINFSARTNDTAGNIRTNDTIFTVTPVVNTTLNKSIDEIKNK